MSQEERELDKRYLVTLYPQSGREQDGNWCLLTFFLFHLNGIQVYSTEMVPLISRGGLSTSIDLI